MKPMLAKPYQAKKQDFPCFIQPKLNGIRGCFIGPDRMQSRSYGREEGLLWDPSVIPHILSILNDLPYFFDGEFYRHGTSLQTINSIIGVKRATPHPQYETIGFHLFDVISPKPQHIRFEILDELSSVLIPPIFRVETYYCHSEQFGDHCYNLFKRNHYEGAIYRDYNAPYGFIENCSNQENRWTTLRKRKDRLDGEYEIIDVNPSNQFIDIQEPHIASLQLLLPSGLTFSGGGGLSNDQKIRYYHNPPINKIARITFDSLSDAGIPLQPSTVLVYD